MTRRSGSCSLVFLLAALATACAGGPPTGSGAAEVEIARPLGTPAQGSILFVRLANPSGIPFDVTTTSDERSTDPTGFANLRVHTPDGVAARLDALSDSSAVELGLLLYLDAPVGPLGDQPYELAVALAPRD